MIWHFRLADAWPLDYSEDTRFRWDYANALLLLPASTKMIRSPTRWVDFSYGGNGVGLQLRVFWGVIWGMSAPCRGRSFSWWDGRSHRGLWMTSGRARAGVSDPLLPNWRKCPWFLEHQHVKRARAVMLVVWDFEQWGAESKVIGRVQRSRLSSQLNSFQNI